MGSDNLKKITISSIRNIGHLEFELPSPGLYVITGKNGSGKTTLFTCISRICNNNAYRNGFLTSRHQSYDEFLGEIKNTVDEQSTTYKKNENGKWRPDNQLKTINRFGYPAVVNITTKNERVFSQQDINPRRRNDPDTWLNEKLNEVFSTNRFSAMTRITTGDLRRGRATNVGRRNTAYVIPLGNNKYYTEQNFSFGEIVMLNLLLDIKGTLNGSVVLIDELELALHPSAQITLITILKQTAAEKGLTIIISTHSSSIIRAQKEVILLDPENNSDIVKVIYHCPPAKAIGAIGMREDSMPDIIALVEDQMAKAMFIALLNKYNEDHQGSTALLDIKVLEIGGYQNVINFYREAIEYIFYNNVYITAFMDNDVLTDVFNYPQYSRREYVEYYNNHSNRLHFLPDTPEVLLMKMLINYKQAVLRSLGEVCYNQNLQYTIVETFDFAEYEEEFPEFIDQNEFNDYMSQRGSFRKKCKNESKRIVESLSEQTNESVDYIYKLIYKLSVDSLYDTPQINMLLASMIRR